jgi:hypothetical protein
MRFLDEAERHSGETERPSPNRPKKLLASPRTRCSPSSRNLFAFTPERSSRKDPANGGARAERFCGSMIPLGVDAKQGVNKGTLSEYIAPRQPADLPFADHVYRLIRVNSVQRALNRTKPEIRGDALLKEAMILLDHVVQIRTVPISSPSAELLVAFEFGDGMGVCLAGVDVDDRWTKLGDTAQRQHETARTDASASFSHRIRLPCAGLRHTPTNSRSTWPGQFTC